MCFLQESDNSSLFFTPIKSRDLDSKWENIVAHQKGRTNHQKDRHGKGRVDQWSSTDSVPETDGSFSAIYLKPNIVTKRRKGKYSNYVSSKKRQDCSIAKNVNKSRRKLVNSIKQWKSDAENKNEENVKNLANIYKSIKFRKTISAQTSSQSSEGSKEKTLSGMGYEGSEESIEAKSSGDDLNEEEVYLNQKLATLRQEQAYTKPEESMEDCFESVPLTDINPHSNNQVSQRTGKMYDITMAEILEGAEYDLKQAAADSGFQSSTCSFNTETTNGGNNTTERYLPHHHHHSLLAMRSSNDVCGSSHQKKLHSVNVSSSGIDSLSMGGSSTSSGCKCSGSGSDEQCEKCSKPSSSKLSKHDKLAVEDLGHNVISAVKSSAIS